MKKKGTLAGTFDPRHGTLDPRQKDRLKVMTSSALTTTVSRITFSLLWSELLESSWIRHGGTPLGASHRKRILLSETECHIINNLLTELARAVLPLRPSCSFSKRLVFFTQKQITNTTPADCQTAVRKTSTRGRVVLFSNQNKSKAPRSELMDELN